MLGRFTENSSTPNKKSKSSVITKDMLENLCNGMAKRGNKPFFEALNSLHLLANVSEHDSEYLKDLILTAKEHGNYELAQMIEEFAR